MTHINGLQSSQPIETTRVPIVRARNSQRLPAAKIRMLVEGVPNGLTNSNMMFHTHSKLPFLAVLFLYGSVTSYSDPTLQYLSSKERSYILICIPPKTDLTTSTLFPFQSIQIVILGALARLTLLYSMVRYFLVETRGNHDMMLTYMLDMHPMDKGIMWYLDPDPFHFRSATFKKMRQWLNTCFHEHNSCRGRPTDHCPLRVLDLSLPDQRRVRLRELNPAKKEPYVTLSYCWGGGQPVATTLATLKSHKAGILVQSLPKTIRDAIHISRGLAIDNLWVDVLCIVQDDDVAKAEEMGNMGYYYSNSVVTLAAVKSESSKTGFLDSVGSSLSVGPFNFPTDGGALMRLGHCNGEHYSSPLFRRAWTLQEWLLSARILSFGTDLISWSCKEITHGSVATSSSHTYLHRVQRQWAIRDSGVPTSVEDASALWDKVIKDYAGRTITKPEDKLPAISGIALQFSTLFSTPLSDQAPKYLAGLWNCSTLPLQMLWVPYRHAQRQDSYVAPTWSWACLSSIKYSYTDWLEMRRLSPFEPIGIKVVASEIHLKYDGAPYGELDKGSVTIEGNVFSCRINELIRTDLILKTDTECELETVKDGIVSFIDFFPALRVRSVPRGLALALNNDGTYRRIGTYYCSLDLSSVYSRIVII
jgi:hypothetical protein